MSKYKVGDKVILTVTSTNEMGCLPCYVLNDDLILSRQDIDKYTEPLTAYTEQARADGAETAWELAKKIVDDVWNGGYSEGKLKQIFGYAISQLCIVKNTYSEAAAKLAEWEKAKEEIKVGDVFQDDDGNNAIVTSIKGNTIYYMWDDGDTRSGFAEDVKKHFTKTGRHIDIDSFFKQIGGENDDDV